MRRVAPRSPARAERRPGYARGYTGRAPRRQRGLVLVLVLALVVAAALWGITSSFGTAAQRVDRDRATMAAIMQAKEALIARAALDIERPGSMPCPDQDNDGAADSVGPSGCISLPGSNFRVGRLPWRTLRLPDLRDNAGERLWYAFSGNFKDNAGFVINSDTPGQIQLTGVAPAQRVIAVIIAPGAPLGQSRDPAVPAQINDVANYLEGENNYKLDPGGVNNDVFQNAPPSSAFNDIVVPITEEELFAVVENMVSLRLRNNIKPLIDSEYRDFWGAYPYPDSAFDPGKAVPPGFVGVTGATEGHLPIGDPTALTFPWTSITVTGPTGDFVGPPACSVTAPGDEATCTTTLLNPNAVLTVELVASNVGRSFAKWDESLVTVEENPPAIPSAATITGTPVGSLDAAGNGTVTVSVLLLSAGTTYKVHFPRPQVNALLTTTKPSAAGANAQFFFDNEWYRLVYYAASPGALPGGPLACTLSTPGAAKSPAPCPLGVDPLYQPLSVTCPPTPQPLPAACLPRVRADGTSEDAGVMLVLAGRVMNVGGTVQSRPAAALAAYLEDAKNLNTPPLAPREFQQKPRSTSFNDRVVVLAP